MTTPPPLVLNQIMTTINSDDRRPILRALDDSRPLPLSLEEIQRSWVLRPAERKKKKKKYVRKMFMWIFAVTVLLGGLIAVVKTVPHHKYKPPPQKDNFTLALPSALMFFNAQRSGRLPEGNNVSWRSDSCLEDGSSGSFYKDLTGGYYDAGDAVKLNYPMSYAMTMLSWSVIEYSAKYEAIGELDHVKGIIKWGTDYFLKTFDTTGDTINTMVSQIESRATGRNDSYCWLRPEDIHYKRWVIGCTTGCSELAAEMAAALASASIVFKDSSSYSAKLVRGAKTLYKFAESVENDKGMYWDDLIWGGAWLYYATGNATYLQGATDVETARRAGASGVFSWENKLPGAQLLLTRLRLFLSPGYPYETGLSTYHKQMDNDMCSYLPVFKIFNRTKGGLIELKHPQPLQYAANAAFLATLYSDYLEVASAPGWFCGPNFYSVDVLRDFSKSQIDYILGKNPQNMSYVVGFGQRYPTHVHHRGASIPKKRGKKESCTGGWKWRDSKKENPNTIVGAMVGGPDKHDGFHDVRTDYNYTEPSLAGNAGLVAALVALSERGKLVRDAIDRNSIFTAVRPLFPATPPPPAPWTP